MVVGAPGCITRVETARLAMKSFNGAQLAPALVVFQMPPPTLPASHTEVLVGSTTMARTRPPTLPGPSQVQLVESIPAASGLGLKPRARADMARFAMVRIDLESV